MSFLQAEFLVFVAALLVVYWAVPARRAQNVLLLGASYVFYGWLSPRLCLLLASVTGANYLAGLAMRRWPHRRDGVLAVVVVASVLDLVWFKYFGWFATELIPRFTSPEQASAIAAWKLALPLGLSFYTFHNLAYSIDVYREKIAVRTDPVDYFLYGSWFPQLVAGPVERPQNVLPQLEAPRRFSPELLTSGLGLALWGAFKKLALADTIAPYVDLIFQSDQASSAMIWAGALGFTIQALADFSGYTDIARGVSRLFGIELMKNFDHPYMAATPMEFWQRWHMSFSTWLRDYVYVPACFSEPVRRWLTIPGTGEWGPFGTTARALLITMLLSGIWHGSTWNFIAWGFYYFCIGTAYSAVVARIPRKRKKQAGWRWVTVPLMFGFTVLGMHIFREPSLARLGDHLLLNPFEGSREQWIVTVAMLGLCAYAALPLIVAMLVEEHVLPRVRGSWAWPAMQSTFWAACAVAAFSSVRTSASDFIYFQF
jgi:D-alanyl-lipoteichoic acid acyltransferase DltB (MBOAT superfamily)